MSLSSLHDHLRSLSRPAIAFSGGLDSRFLCATALAAGCDVLALHVRGPHIPQAESLGARAFARTMGLVLEELVLDPLDLPEVARTGKRRCYACKTFMLTAMRAHLAARGEGDRVLCDGSNLDDRSAYRPGLQALEEQHVLSPLALAGLTKEVIVREAGKMGFPLPDEKARPCLLTRYAYGLQVDREELARIERAEQALLALKDGQGRSLLDDFRLRLTPEPVLQVTSLGEDDVPAVRAVLDEHGFAPCSIVRTKSISGFFDRT